MTARYPTPIRPAHRDHRLAAMATDGIPRGVEQYLQARYRHDAMPADYPREVTPMTQYQIDSHIEALTGHDPHVSRPLGLGPRKTRRDWIEMALVYVPGIIGGAIFLYALAVIVYGLVTR